MKLCRLYEAIGMDITGLDILLKRLDMTYNQFRLATKKLTSEELEGLIHQQREPGAKLDDIKGRARTVLAQHMPPTKQKMGGQGTREIEQIQKQLLAHAQQRQNKQVRFPRPRRKIF